jgi:carboxymethylenebutenolidase
VDGKVGAIGFCWGGTTVNRLAESDDSLDANVVYYGLRPRLISRPDQGAIAAQLCRLDSWLGPLLPDYEKALQAAGVKYALHAYEGANHAFNDDTQRARYDPEASKLAWMRTMAFFKQHLG